jgi:hypothetical protein
LMIKWERSQNLTTLYRLYCRESTTLLQKILQ